MAILNHDSVDFEMRALNSQNGPTITLRVLYG